MRASITRSFAMITFTVTIATIASVSTAIALPKPDLKPSMNCGLPEFTQDLEQTKGIQAKKMMVVNTESRLHPMLSKQIKRTVEMITEKKQGLGVAVASFTRENGYEQGFSVGDRSFEMVSFFPGDQEYGAIYRAGSTEVVALINQSEIHCR